VGPRTSLYALFVPGIKPLPNRSPSLYRLSYPDSIIIIIYLVIIIIIIIIYSFIYVLTQQAKGALQSKHEQREKRNKHRHINKRQNKATCII
jgi:hypothetical protein